MRTRPNITRAAAFTLIVGVFFAAVATFVPDAQAQDDMVITPTSVGSAEIGSTVDELTEQLGGDYEVGDEVRITVDFTGHVVSRDGEVQFRAVKANDPGDELSLFIINNDEFMTAEGVGPGISIADAEAIYGEATLNWNPDNEGREFVTFENQPEGRIQFRTPGIAGTNVGIYGDGEFETNEYEPEGTIAAVWISCVPGTDCPADAGAAGGEEPEEEPTPTPTPEEEPTPTPTPEPTAEPDPGEEEEGSESGTTAPSGGSGGELPATGFEEVLLISLASSLFLIGGFMVLVHRSYLAPAWLRSRRW